MSEKIEVKKTKNGSVIAEQKQAQNKIDDQKYKDQQTARVSFKKINGAIVAVVEDSEPEFESKQQKISNGKVVKHGDSIVVSSDQDPNDNLLTDREQITARKELDQIKQNNIKVSNQASIDPQVVKVGDSIMVDPGDGQNIDLLVYDNQNTQPVEKILQVEKDNLTETKAKEKKQRNRLNKNKTVTRAVDAETTATTTADVSSSQQTKVETKTKQPPKSKTTAETSETTTPETDLDFLMGTPSK